MAINLQSFGNSDSPQYEGHDFRRP
jgi:hypothetical protein